MAVGAASRRDFFQSAKNNRGKMPFLQKHNPATLFAGSRSRQGALNEVNATQFREPIK
jgi:hypothetical protein